MEKVALILIYVTLFSSSLLRSISWIYFFWNVHATMMNLAYFDPLNSQLEGLQLYGASFPQLSLLRPSPWMGWWCNYSLRG